MTPFQRHVAKWSACTACPLHQCRRKVVLARGSVPAQVLFIGEAPGHSEDTLGRPFVGPAGQLLDAIIADAMSDQPKPISYCLTNLVACIPLEEGTATKTEEPPRDAIEECAPRLKELVDLCKPQLLVCVGGLADKHAHGGLGKATMYAGGRVDGHATLKHWTSIVHPAGILRANVAAQGIMRQRATVVLSNALRSMQ